MHQRVTCDRSILPHDAILPSHIDEQSGAVALTNSIFDLTVPLISHAMRWAHSPALCWLSASCRWNVREHLSVESYSMSSFSCSAAVMPSIFDASVLSRCREEGVERSYCAMSV